MANKHIEDTKRLDAECLKCKHLFGKCVGRMTGKAIPRLCFEEKEEDNGRSKNN